MTYTGDIFRMLVFADGNWNGNIPTIDIVIKKID